MRAGLFNGLRGSPESVGPPESMGSPDSVGPARPCPAPGASICFAARASEPMGPLNLLLICEGLAEASFSSCSASFNKYFWNYS